MSEPDLERDDRGRFAPGNSGGPGRPRRQTEADYLVTLSSHVTADAWSKIIERAVNDAIAGDARAREWLSRHLLPTPSPNSAPLHDAAVEDISGVSKVEADAETSRMNRLALDTLRRM